MMLLFGPLTRLLVGSLARCRKAGSGGRGLTGTALYPMPLAHAMLDRTRLPDTPDRRGRARPYRAPPAVALLVLLLAGVAQDYQFAQIPGHALTA